MAEWKTNPGNNEAIAGTFVIIKKIRLIFMKK